MAYGSLEKKKIKTKRISSSSILNTGKKERLVEHFLYVKNIKNRMSQHIFNHKEMLLNSSRMPNNSIILRCIRGKFKVSDSDSVFEVIGENVKKPIYKEIFKPYEFNPSNIRNLIYGISLTEKGQEILQLENFYDFSDEHLKTLEILQY